MLDEQRPGRPPRLQRGRHSRSRSNSRTWERGVVAVGAAVPVVLAEAAVCGAAGPDGGWSTLAEAG